MADERRMYPRQEADMRLSLIFDGREVPVSVRNISGGGAYVEVEKGHGDRVLPSDVGRVARLRMEAGANLASSHGRILRFVEEEGAGYVALAFGNGAV